MNMLNQIVLVGRLVSDPTDNKITLAVNRSYKNAEGVYETDFIDIRIFGTIASNTCEYCKKGDIIGVKGRLEGIREDDGDGHFKNETVVVAEKITFLSSRHDTDMRNV